MKFTLTIFMSFIFGIQLYAGKPEKTINEEIYRPQFHFSPEKHVLEDICGLVYYDREYHLCYQFHQFNTPDTTLVGHAISNDLLHWKHIPFDLFENGNSPSISGGSIIIDENNKLGLQKGNTRTMLFFYTGNESGQCIAYSTDKGRSWLKYTNNPVISSQKDIYSCPKVIFHKPTNQFVMILHRFPEINTEKESISFYTSENLTDWEFKSHIEGFGERVDLVELSINRRPDDTKWVLFDSDGSYLIGEFNGEKFISEGDKIQGNFGKNFYGPQTFNGLPLDDGRKIQMAWMKGGEFKGMSFNGQMTFPCEISLRKYIEGVRLIRKPVDEINILHDKKDDDWKDKLLIPGINQNLISSVKGDCLHFKGSFDLKSTNNFGFILRMNKKKNGTELIFTTKNNQLLLLGSKTNFESPNGKITLEILLDRSSIELFVNEGKVTMSSCFSPEERALGTYLFTIGGEAFVEKLNVYLVHSILNKEE